MSNFSKSVQGEWTDALWGQYPKHMIESSREIPHRILEALPPRPIMSLKQRPHRQTAIARKKYPLFEP